MGYRAKSRVDIGGHSAIVRLMAALPRIQRLHSIDPHCYFCHCLTRIIPNIPSGQKHPDDMATIDHLVTRYNAEHGEARPYVLACWRCNNQRAAHDPTDARLKERHSLSRHTRDVLVRLMMVSGRVLDIQGMVAAVQDAYDSRLT